MTHLSESGLLFQFNDSWDIIKYDTHKYYLTLSGRSFRGIDFAGFQNDILYLIEVKNFYQYDQNGVIDDIEKFALEIAEKIKDTLRLIDLIYKYHNRKWMYRLFFPVVRKFPRLHHDWLFWTAMERNISERNNTHFVLYVLSDQKTELIKRKIEQALVDDIRKWIKLVIVNTDNEGDIPQCSIINQQK